MLDRFNAARKLLKMTEHHLQNARPAVGGASQSRAAAARVKPAEVYKLSRSNVMWSIPSPPAEHLLAE